MNYILRTFLLAAALAAGSCAKDATQDNGSAKDAGPIIVNASAAAIDGEIILKIKANASDAVEETRSANPAAKGSGIDEIDHILTSVGTVQFERLFPTGGRFEERTRKEGLHLWYYAKYDPSVPTAEVAKMLSTCRDIEIIEYSLAAASSDYRRIAPDAAAADTRAVSDELREIPFPFNEDIRSQQLQWHYNNTGSIYTQQTRMGADANVYAAWQLTTGSPDVIVAVVDQGVKYDHEDLAANMWINTAEQNGMEGVDDDGNGYVDDIYGFNFTTNSGELNFSGELTHGTHVAGTVSAVNNNSIGVCGVAGGSGKGDGVKIMSCEILGKSESGSSGSGLAGQIRAIKYAADNGAVICQNSWGYSSGTISATDWKKGTYSALTRAMQYFNTYAGMDENGVQTGPMAGGIILFAAGNDASNETCYPAADPNVVSVASISFSGTPSYFTNYGKWVQLSAPGGDLTLNSIYGGIYSTSIADDGSSSYEGIQGTSMACPHVSGACALAVSYYYGPTKRKGLTGEMLRQALLSSTRPIDRLCTGSFAKYLGNVGLGNLDTYKLLLSIAKIDGIPAQHIARGKSITLDLSNYFVSTNILTYTVSDPQIVSVSLAAGILKIGGLEAGHTTIILSDGSAIRKPIEITVE